MCVRVSSDSNSRGALLQRSAMVFNNIHLVGAAELVLKTVAGRCSSAPPGSSSLKTHAHTGTQNLCNQREQTQTIKHCENDEMMEMMEMME